MTLAERKEALERERAQAQALRVRAVQAVQQADVQMVRLDAQIALLAELMAEAG